MEIRLSSAISLLIISFWTAAVSAQIPVGQNQREAVRSAAVRQDWTLLRSMLAEDFSSPGSDGGEDVKGPDQALALWTTDEDALEDMLYALVEAVSCARIGDQIECSSPPVDPQCPHDPDSGAAICSDETLMVYAVRFIRDNDRWKLQSWGVRD